jgi:hypothetical protein
MYVFTLSGDFLILFLVKAVIGYSFEFLGFSGLKLFFYEL